MHVKSLFFYIIIDGLCNKGAKWRFTDSHKFQANRDCRNRCLRTIFLLLMLRKFNLRHGKNDVLVTHTR